MFCFCLTSVLGLSFTPSLVVLFLFGGAITSLLVPVSFLFGGVVYLFSVVPEFLLILSLPLSLPGRLVLSIVFPRSVDVFLSLVIVLLRSDEVFLSLSIEVFLFLLETVLSSSLFLFVKSRLPVLVRVPRLT